MDDARATRIRNALWGLFVGDALAMPAHWIYSLSNLKEAFGGGIRGYVDPPHPHPESFMVGMAYRPDVESAKRLGRPYDILHEHARFYSTPYSSLEIDLAERESEHGNITPRAEERYHYHHGLEAGENTLGAHLVRVLLRSIGRLGRYEERAFLVDFVEHLATRGRNRDPYTEVYLRRWFENYSLGHGPRECAAHQRDIWSIGSHGGILRPLALSLLAASPYQGLGLAIEHQNLTHRSQNVSGALGVLVPLLHELLGGADATKAIASHAPGLRAPRVTGEALFAAYRDHKGPGNIPSDEMWRLHTDLRDDPLDLDALGDESDVVRRTFANACYPEHGVPLLLYLAYHHGADAEASLLANANAGGDNVHRGMILGLLVGAGSREIPAHLRDGLADSAELAQEIEEFVAVAASGEGI